MKKSHLDIRTNYCAVSFGLLLFLSACATTPEENDPSEGGFFRAVQGVSGGQYEARREAREAKLADEQRAGQHLEDRLAQLEAEQAELDREIQLLLDDLSAIDEDIQSALHHLEGMSQRNTELEEDFRRAHLRLAELRHSLTEERFYATSEIEQIGSSIREMEELVLSLTARM